MYNKYFYGILVLLFCTCSISAQQANFRAQQQLLDQKKLAGLLNGTELIINPNAGTVNSRVTPPITPHASTAACNCWITRDASWTIAQFDYQGGSGGPGVAPDYRNDDWSQAPLTLPFNLCFYGQSVNSVIINNNGNVSVGAPYSTFTANSFPDPTYIMIAPFWADVDTRAPTSGLVYYKLTPTYLIVQWDHVGYFPSTADKVNTFQLIITDGNDPILGVGNNVSFCYQDMQWTTGGASGGVNGFGGTPATVGVNQGNGIDYVQFGLFDQAGGVYDGPFGANDGVDWLDNQNFTFSFCTSNANIPPVLNTLNVCDTIRLCEGQTVTYTANYYAPEQGQNTTITLNPGTMTGLNVVSNTPGNTASITFTITGQASNIGTHLFQLQAQDDGVPVGITTNEILVLVYPSPTANFSFSPVSPIQINTPVTFTNTSGGIGNLYTWFFGDGASTTLLNPLHTYTTAGTYDAMLVVRNFNGCTDTIHQTIVVNACSTSPFTTTNVCNGLPSTISYTGNGGAGAVYNWNFAGGTVLSGSGQGPYSVQWSSPGTYNVSLTVTENGCTSTPTILPAIVYPFPVASYSGIPNLCAGSNSNVSFNGITGGTATYNWNFGGASVISGSGVGPYNVQFVNAGNYQVTLTVTENGCSNTVQNNVTVNALPTAAFVATPAACANAPVAVTYNGTGTAGATYNWNFGGGVVQSGSGAGPYSLTYGTGGTYNVSLTVTENNCTSTPVNQNVNITTVPVASISSTPSLCINASNPISYSGAAGAGAAYVWNFDNGVIASGAGAGPYSISWPTAGNYNVTVSVNENGCTATTSVPITVNAIPTSAFTVGAAACAGSPLNVVYTGTGTAGANYVWNFNGANVNSGSAAGPYDINFSIGGSYNVTLTVTENGCVGTPLSMPVTITNTPVAAMTATPSLCINANNTFTFTGAGTGTTNYVWNFPGGNVTSGSSSGPYNVNWPSAGQYVVSLSMDDNGCTAATTYNVTVNDIPNSLFTITPAACSGTPVSVSYTGTATSNGTYNWNFNGGTVTSGSGAGPYQITYPTGGNYNVTLAVSENGCSGAPISMPVAITDAPIPMLAATPSICVNDNNTISFTGTAIGTATFTWDFAGATVTSGAGIGPYNTSWSTPGSYTVSVTVDQNGCVATTTTPVRVNYIPTSLFTVTPSVCVGNPVTVSFTGVATNASNYTWNFNGGTVVSGAGAGPYSILFATAGTNPIFLTVDESNCVSTPTNQQTVINPIPPVFAGTDATVCPGVVVPVGDPNTIAGAVYSWLPVSDLADPTAAATAATPSNNGMATQYTNYILTVTDANGCINHDSVRVGVYPVPVVNFNSLTQQCVDNNKFTFAANSSIPNGVNFSWDFAGGTPGTSLQSSEQVSYASTGTYMVTLRADYNGCPATAYQDTVRVNPMPVSDFIPQVFVGCEPLDVPFSNLSVGSNNTYAWNYFDGSSPDFQDQPIHTFTNAGLYSVSLVATNEFGCKNDTTLRNIINVYPSAIARFSPNPSTANILSPTVQFQNYSVNANTYGWTFGDGDSDLVRNPSHTYTDTGTFNIVLVVVSPDGCRDTVSALLRVEDNYAFYIPNSFTPNGDGINDSFRGFGVAIKNYTMAIYNRWGEVIFRTNDYDKPWDGRVKDVVQNDVYVYRIELMDQHDEKHVYLGNVSVIR